MALDIAFQCSPDHPYVNEHPQWFRQRPDGTIQYAENPPKKYQDIYPFDFETSDWQALWRELTDVVLFWCEQGVRIFRVDNPHTKPFAFWEFLIGEVKAQYPETIFLSEAFTRPKVMYRLAKLGFTPVVHVFHLAEHEGRVDRIFHRADADRGPRVLPAQLVAQHARHPARALADRRPRRRLRPGFVLAATLGSNYGIYGPAYETLENRPREPGSEEYLDSEKYQIRSWDFDRPDNLRQLDHRGQSGPPRECGPAIGCALAVSSDSTTTN